jgi:hypothetical protein
MKMLAMPTTVEMGKILKRRNELEKEHGNIYRKLRDTQGYSDNKKEEKEEFLEYCKSCGLSKFNSLLYYTFMTIEVYKILHTDEAVSISRFLEKNNYLNDKMSRLKTFKSYYYALKWILAYRTTRLIFLSGEKPNAKDD